MISMKPSGERVVMAVRATKKSPTIDAIIFDCFGVLYLDVKQSLLNTLPADQAEALSDIFQQNNYGMLTRREYVAAVSEVTGMASEEFVAFTAIEHRLNTVLVDRIHELKKTYKIGLLSNIGRDWINDFFDAHQLHDLFDAVVLSGEEGMTKPHPLIYEMMATRLGVEPEQCVMIDDIEANCTGAEIAGMKAIHFVSNDQLRADLKKIGV